MNNPRPTIFLSAAETSGDLHGANLITALRRRLPNAKFIGLGGPQMASAGCELIQDLTTTASNLTSPLLHLPYWLKMVKRIQRKIIAINPALHIPIDSPALNWHLAIAAKQCDTPVFYYIAPKVWAWAPWRIKKLARLTDHVACILPFEQRYFRDRGVNATYVGHPLFDHLPPRPTVMPNLTEAYNNGSWKVVFAPGSRPREIRGNTKAFLAVAKAIKIRWPKSECIFTTAAEESANTVREIADKIAGDMKIKIVAGKTPEMLSQAHFAIAKSGTVTLEAAWYGTAMVIPYRTARWMSLIPKYLTSKIVKTPFFSPVNIIAGSEIVPEMIPWQGQPKPLIQTVLNTMGNLDYLSKTRQTLLDLVTPLRVKPPATASDNAAELAIMLMQRSK